MCKAKGGKFGKAKGKGRDGKNSGGGKVKGKDGKGETRICNWCAKTGHLIAECRAKAAGKPKVKPAAGAASLDKEAWEEDLQAHGLDCRSLELQFCCQECLDPVHEYDGDDADEGGEWVLEPRSWNSSRSIPRPPRRAHSRPRGRPRIQGLRHHRCVVPSRTASGVCRRNSRWSLRP